MTEEITLTHEQALALAEAETAHIRIKRIRADIKATSGDTLSLLGTTADATQLLLFGFASLITQLHSATTLAEVRAAAAPFHDLATDFLAKVESGQVKLPYQVKGLDVAMREIEQRATAVAETLAAAAPPNTPPPVKGDDDG